MKKRFGFILAIVFATLCSLGLASCGGGSDGGYYIKADLKDLVVSGNEIAVEYGNSFTIPGAFVTDDGEEEYDVDVAWKLVSSSGEDLTKTSKLFFLEPDEYTLTYSASAEGVAIKDVVYKVVCADTLAPEITVVGLLDTYDVGDNCVVTIQNIKDASGTDESKTFIKAYFG
ncbi:MAG: hypothetical protein J5903_02045, partial [Clostridia bacterium]|nr:hypothetical protein [Clostridia bacterium]